MKRTTSIIITAAVAFALAFTIFPVTDVNAGNTEPTLPASQMVKANGNGDQSGNDGD